MILIPTRTSLQDARQDKSEEGWTKNTTYGFPVLIAKNRVNYVERFLYFYIQPQDFTPAKLKRIFTGFASDFSNPHDLWMFAYSDKESLKSVLASKPAAASVDFVPSPEGRRAERQYNQRLYGLRLKQRGLRASYFRLDVRESLTYDIEQEKGIEITLDLKHPDPEYSGDATADLVIAIEYNDLAKVQAVIGASADVNRESKDGTPPLMLAVWRGESEIVRALLKAGAKVNYKLSTYYDDDETALMWAALQGDADIIQLLLGAGADINAHDKQGKFYDAETALIKAAKGGYFKAVQALVDRGAKVDDRNCLGETALIVAAGAGSAETVQLLLDSGANVNARDNHGMTALMLAFDDKETVETLLRNGCDYKARDQEGMTALMHSLRESASEKLNVLIENGAGNESIEAARAIMATAPDVDWLPRDFGKQQGYRILSEIYLKLGMKQEAIETSRQALEVFGDQADLREQLGLTYLAVGDKESAVSQYQTLKERADRAQDKESKRLYQLTADCLWRELNE